MTMGTMNQITDLNAPAALSRRTAVAAPAPSPFFAAPNSLNAVPPPPPPPPRDADTQLNPKNNAFEVWGSRKNPENHPSNGPLTPKTAFRKALTDEFFVRKSSNSVVLDRFFSRLDRLDRFGCLDRHYDGIFVDPATVDVVGANPRVRPAFDVSFDVSAYCVNNTKTHNNSNIRTLTGGEGRKWGRRWGGRMSECVERESECGGKDV